MKPSQILAITAAAMLVRTASALITIITVPVGNTGNANDPNTGFGAVGYDYSIGKYEVTLNQYTAFLNAVAATDTHSLYNTSLGADSRVAGIAQSGVSGNYTYSVIGTGDRPVTYVSWFNSARFVNWLQNGQPTGAQAVGTTETGAYTLNGAMSGTTFTRNVNSTYGLPSENEWYKAAYYQPAGQGGDSDSYWLYPTQSNETPNSRNGSTTDANSANFFRDDNNNNGFNGGYAVSQSWDPPFGGALTDAGAFSLADSFYGTFDQAGNAYEWNDAVVGAARGLRGASWGSSEYYMSAYARVNPVTSVGLVNVGFRIAVIPEPSFVSLIGLGIALLAGRRKRSN